MLNPLSFISKIFKSSNDIELGKFRKILEKINLLENDVAKIKDSDFPNKTNELKNQIKSGKNLDEVLPEFREMLRNFLRKQRKCRFAEFFVFIYFFEILNFDNCWNC